MDDSLTPEGPNRDTAKCPECFRQQIIQGNSPWHKKHLGKLERHGNAKQTWRRIHASVALARLGDDGAISRLNAEIDTLPAEWFPRFVRVLSTIAEPDVRAKLEPELERRPADPLLLLAYVRTVTADRRFDLASAAIDRAEAAAPEEAEKWEQLRRGFRERVTPAP